MRFDGFIGASYPNYSVLADCQRAINLYREIVPGDHGKSPSVLYGTPGKAEFVTLPDGPNRAMFTIKQLSPRVDRTFVINGATFYELFSNGTYNAIGTVINDHQPAQIDENATQLFIASGQTGYVYNKTTGVFTGPIANVQPASVHFLDSFFIAHRDATQDFYISAPNDGLTWDPIDFGTASGNPDSVVAVIVDHRQLWIFGSNSIQVFFNSGAADFPFENTPGGLIEQGTIAANSPVKLDNSVFWLGGDVRGGGMVFRADGFRPMRISNHAVENAIRKMTSVSTMRAYGYQENGHSFYVMNFVDDNQTWVYDVTTDEWHERALWSLQLGTNLADRAVTHTYAFNAHLVGDSTSNTIWRSSVDIFQDGNDLIRRVRRAPHLSDEMKWTMNRRLNIDIEAGIGLNGVGYGSDPQISLRWSNDGGKNWSNERVQAAGKIGESTRRAQFNRLGKSRDRVYEMVLMDPVKWAILDAFFDSGAGKRG